MGTKLNPDVFDAYSKAKDDEEYFCLIARDPYAPGVVRRWANLLESDIAEGDVPPYYISKVAEARAVADRMEAWHKENIKALPPSEPVGKLII